MNEELKENIKKIKIDNKEYKLCEYMFGVLEMDHNNPLSCVSEANNSFSIDFWKGCIWQCSYCHIQGIYEDLDKNYKMYTKPQPRSDFTIEQIINALIEHKYFKKDVSVISIGTSSTEPFGNSEVTESTLKIMEYFVKLGLKNPFWIVTKAGIPNNIEDRLKKIIDNGNKIMISLCWCNNPKDIEPIQNDRFRNIKKLQKIELTISWYMRPLAEEWGANKNNLEDMIKFISKNYYKDIDMIIPGGLRWTEGIEFGMKTIRNLKMPKLVKNDNVKTLSYNIEYTIIELCKKYFPDKPVYFHSSCGISQMLNSPNIALLNLLDKDICKKSICHNNLKNKCKKKTFTKSELKVFEAELKKVGIDIVIKNIENNKINTIPDMSDYSYTIQQQIKKTIANAINEMEEWIWYQKN